MFDPKTVYRELDMKDILGDSGVRCEIRYRDWPCQELAFLRVYTFTGQERYVLIANGSTPETVEKELRRVVKLITEGG